MRLLLLFVCLVITCAQKVDHYDSLFQEHDELWNEFDQNALKSSGGYYQNYRHQSMPNDYDDNWHTGLAGSCNYGNYRHQSDVFHYQTIVRNNGARGDNIITLAYNDTPYSPNNPTPGVIVNQYDQQNVYKNVVIDYQGHQVNKNVFMTVLKGDIGIGKVLESNLDSYVVVYFSDHGGSNCLEIIDRMLYADELIETLIYMHEHNMYKKLLFIVEACESGSMFNGLLRPDLNILAITASTPYESSYACGPSRYRGTYINDCFSINFLKQLEQKSTMSKTIGELFGIVKHETEKSTACAYGDLSILDLPVSTFFVYNDSDDNLHSHAEGHSFSEKPIRDITSNMRAVINDKKDVLYSVTLHDNDFYLHNLEWPERVNNYDVDMLVASYMNKTLYEELSMIALACDMHFEPYFQVYKNVNNYMYARANQCHVPLPKLDFECYRKLISELPRDFVTTTHCKRHFRYLTYACMNWDDFIL